MSFLSLLPRTLTNPFKYNPVTAAVNAHGQGHPFAQQFARNMGANDFGTDVANHVNRYELHDPQPVAPVTNDPNTVGGGSIGSGASTNVQSAQPTLAMQQQQPGQVQPQQFGQTASTQRPPQITSDMLMQYLQSQQGGMM